MTRKLYHHQSAYPDLSILTTHYIKNFMGKHLFKVINRRRHSVSYFFIPIYSILVKEEQAL